MALFEAFFSRREDVSDVDVLCEVLTRVGLDGAAASALLLDARYAAQVRREQRHWLEREVHAVPTFFLQDQYIVPGAQDAETFVRVLQKIRVKSDRVAS